MLQLEPSKRITTKGAIEHPFFSEFHSPSSQPLKGQTSLCGLPVITPKKHTHYKMQKENVNPTPGKTPDKLRLSSVSKLFNFYNNQSNSHRKSFGSNTKMSFPDPFVNNRSDSVVADGDFPFRPLNKQDTPTYQTSGNKGYTCSVQIQPLAFPGSAHTLGLQNNVYSEGVNSMSTPKNFSTNRKVKNLLAQDPHGNPHGDRALAANHNTSKKKRRRAATNRLNAINDENDDRMNLQLQNQNQVSEDNLDPHMMAGMAALQRNSHLNQPSDPTEEYAKINGENWQHKQQRHLIGHGLTAHDDVRAVGGVNGNNHDVVAAGKMATMIQCNDHCMTIDEDVE